MNISEFIKADSTQWNADDLVSGPLTAQIAKIAKGNKDQPVNIHLEGHEKVWRPCKTSLRVLAAVMGLDTEKWVGHWVKLYRDPHVKWAGAEVGGIRIEALSAIDQTATLTLTETRGRKTPHQVKPLKAPENAPTGLELKPPKEDPADPESPRLSQEQIDEIRALHRDVIRTVKDRPVPSEKAIANAYGCERLEDVGREHCREIVGKLEKLIPKSNSQKELGA